MLSWDGNNGLQMVTLVCRNATNPAQNDRDIYQYRDGMRLRKPTRTLTNEATGLWTVNEVRYLPGLELRSTWQESDGIQRSSLERMKISRLNLPTVFIGINTFKPQGKLFQLQRRPVFSFWFLNNAFHIVSRIMAHKLLLDGMTQDGGDVLLDPHGSFKIANRFSFFLAF